MYPLLATATSFVPSDDDATDCQFCCEALCVQVAPESADVYAKPL
jgi:hypothetical protein